MRVPLEAGWLDLSAGIYVRNGSSEALRPMETRLLRYLAERAGRAVPQDELLAEVWGYAPQVRSRTVRVTVSRLRSKIEVDPTCPRHLITISGEGYALRPGGAALGDASGLVGRADDLAAIARALTQSRVVELVGIGGIGKSAVARVIAAGITGSLWIEAKGARTADELELQAAASLGVSTAGLPHALAQAPLVVIDEVEAVSGGAELIDRWSRMTCALVTSRVRLGIAAAGTYELPPLSDEATTELLRRVWSRSSLATPPDVGPLVNALGGLPLAVELTEAWAPLLSPEDLAARIGSDALSGVLAQSLQLLKEPALAALRSLAVCPIGARLEQAAELTDLPSLLTLRRHSLVLRDSGRLDMLTPVRDYVLDRFDTATEARRHAEVFAAEATRAVAAQSTHQQPTAWQWMVDEAPNLRRALGHRSVSADGRLGVLQALDSLGLMLGPATLHHTDLSSVDGLDANGLAWHRIAHARRLRESGELDAAVRHGQRALDQAGSWVSEAADELARSLSYSGRQADAWKPAKHAVATAITPAQRAVALRGLARLHRFAGDGAQATSTFESAAELAKNASPGLWAGILSNLGEHVGTTDAERGRALLEQALVVQEELGLERDRGVALLRRGYLQPTPAMRARDYTLARQLALEIGSVRVEVHANSRLAQLAMESGQHDYADALSASIDRARELGDPNLVAILTLNRAHMRTDRGEFEAAEEDYSAALGLYETIGMPLYTGTGLFMGGQGAAVAGNEALARDRLERARVCWAHEVGGRAQIDAMLALLDGRVATGSEAEPWFRWAVEGGERPTAPDPAESWTARQLATGRIRTR